METWYQEGVAFGQKQGKEQGIELGKEQGIEIGERNAKRETALSLAKMGILRKLMAAILTHRET